MYTRDVTFFVRRNQYISYRWLYTILVVGGNDEISENNRYLPAEKSISKFFWVGFLLLGFICVIGIGVVSAQDLESGSPGSGPDIAILMHLSKWTFLTWAISHSGPFLTNDY